MVLETEYCKELDSSMPHSLGQEQLKSVIGSSHSPSTLHVPSEKNFLETVFEKLAHDKLHKLTLALRFF